MRISAVIMAGGRGERFWPSSREDRPKQFLCFDGTESLLQRTVRRLEGLCEDDDIWVVTRHDFAELVREQLPFISQDRILLEPQGRDTAACVALATMYVRQYAPDSVMVVLPADHLVLQEARFQETLNLAISVASELDYLVTLGIRPTRPETGYGYIQVGDSLLAQDGVYRVKAFKEKPPQDQALAYLQSGDFLWNSGIFIWKTSTIRQALVQHLPDLVRSLDALENVLGTELEAGVLEKIYPSLPKLSVDCGVMEKADNVLVVPADFGWDDLGTWAALERVLPSNEDGNIISGRVLAVDSSRSVLHSEQAGRLLVVFGVSDLVVVDTEDVLLVADKQRVPHLKDVVGRLEEEGLQEHLRTPRVGTAVG